MKISIQCGCTNAITAVTVTTKLIRITVTEKLQTEKQRVVTGRMNISCLYPISRYFKLLDERQEGHPRLPFQTFKHNFL